MSGPTFPPSRTASSQPDFVWYDKETGLQTVAEVKMIIATTQDPGAMQGYAYVQSSAFATLTTEPKTEEQHVGLAKSPRIWWAWAMRMVMSTKSYRAEFEPRIAEMYDEYYECIARGDERAARLVVLRWNIAVLPSWVWGHVWCVAWRLVDWLMGR